MTKVNEIYKCNICGNIFEMLHAGAGHPVCCGEETELLAEKTEDTGKEKHVPVVEKTEKGFKIKIGEVEHPMEEGHYIEWIEVLANGKAYRKFLNPGDKPEAEFCIKADNVIVCELCNIHGLWKKDM